MTNENKNSLTNQINEYLESVETEDIKIDSAEKQNNMTADGKYYDGEFETIKYLEYIANRLVKNGIEPKRVFCICQALKYLSSRLGSKEDTPVELDLEKAENYIHRARVGKWMHNK